MSRVLTPAEADRRFFQRFAHRRHRIRAAARSEIEAAHRKGILTVSPPAGYRVFVGVRSDGFGLLRFEIGVLIANADCDMAEEDARDAFGILRHQDDAQLTAWAARQQEAPHA